MAVTEEDFRQIALSLPGTQERQHMGHPDFRVNGKIFATLESPDDGWGMVRIEPELQAELVGKDPGAFAPASGAWGAQGCTHVRLDNVSPRLLKMIIRAAWRLRSDSAGPNPKAGAAERTRPKRKPR
jgi:hypothetical protein